MPLGLRVPRGDLVGAALVTAAVVGGPVAGLSAQSSRETDKPVRISRLPCRLIAQPSVRKVIDEAWDRSETVRRQCEELAAARAVVVVEWGPSDSQSHARAAMGVQGGVVAATVRIPALGDTIVLLAHELQHVIEKTRGVDVETEAKRADSGVWRAFGGYETQAAIDVTRRVARELRETPKERRGLKTAPYKDPESGRV
jgi:hypothetical protein